MNKLKKIIGLNNNHLVQNKQSLFNFTTYEVAFSKTIDITEQKNVFSVNNKNARKMLMTSSVFICQ